MTGKMEVERKPLAIRQIDEARRILLKRLLDPSLEARTNQRKLIKELLPELKALRDAGATFGELAADLHKIGLTFSENTLKIYYYDEVRQQREETEAQERIAFYRLAAKEATLRFRQVTGTDVESLVNKTMDNFFKRMAKSDIQLPLATPEEDRRNDEKKSSSEPGGDAFASSLPTWQEKEKAKTSESMQGPDIEKLLDMKIDISAIPRRKD